MKKIGKWNIYLVEGAAGDVYAERYLRGENMSISINCHYSFTKNAKKLYDSIHKVSDIGKLSAHGVCKAHIYKGRPAHY